MSTKFVKGDALDYADKEGYCMIHVCNNRKKMGSGVAKQVKERQSQSYEAYMAGSMHLGSISGDIHCNVINMIAQDGYGYDGKKYLVDEALEQCLRSVESVKGYMVNKGVHTVVMPYKMGADRAGGDWQWVLSKVEEILGRHFNILIVEWGGK